jgi:hypothetical protein
MSISENWKKRENINYQFYNDNNNESKKPNVQTDDGSTLYKFAKKPMLFLNGAYLNLGSMKIFSSDTEGLSISFWYFKTSNVDHIILSQGYGGKGDGISNKF